MIAVADVHHIPLRDKSVDLVFCSPPYEAARTYGIGFNLRGQAWVDWASAGFMECLRVCRGLVAWVVEGQTRKFRYSAAPVLFMADLHRRGVHLRKPPVFKRVGIPGSGGPDWLRNDYEFIVCGTSGGKLPWSDNTACGHAPRWAPGGAMSHRLSNGTRTNQWGKATVDDDGTPGAWSERQANGELKTVRRKPSHKSVRKYDGVTMANPGNVINCTAGFGHLGDHRSHENEAPFPEKLAEFFVRSFCPPGGIVLDPFGGSGTTLAVANKWHRRGISFDIRQSQCELMRRRVSEVQLMLPEVRT